MHAEEKRDDTPFSARHSLISAPTFDQTPILNPSQISNMNKSIHNDQNNHPNARHSLSGESNFCQTPILSQSQISNMIRSIHNDRNNHPGARRSLQGASDLKRKQTETNSKSSYKSPCRDFVSTDQSFNCSPQKTQEYINHIHEECNSEFQLMEHDDNSSNAQKSYDTRIETLLLYEESAMHCDNHLNDTKSFAQDFFFQRLFDKIVQMIIERTRSKMRMNSKSC